MEFAEPISQNLRKFVKSLEQRKEREDSGFFVAEGYRICTELLKSAYITEFIVITGDPSEDTTKLAEKFHKKNIPVYVARRKQFEQLCETKSPQDILAVVRIASTGHNPDAPIIVLDGVADPGNLGTIIRTADWFGFGKVITSGDSVDRYNGKVVRASMGSMFRVNVESVPDMNTYLKTLSNNYDIFGATLSAFQLMEEVEPTRNFALVFGNEANGITPQVKKLLTKEFLISGGGGRAESLNVAVSVGVSCYYFGRYSKK